MRSLRFTSDFGIRLKGHSALSPCLSHVAKRPHSLSVMLLSHRQPRGGKSPLHPTFTPQRKVRLELCHQGLT